MLNTLRRTAAALAAGALALLLAVPALAQRDGKAIEGLLQTRDREIKTIIGKSNELTPAQEQRLRAVVNDVIDFEAMSRTALGDHWAKLSPAQRREFVETFAGVVRAQSLANLDLYRAVVAYDGVDVEGGVATARTTATVTRKGKAVAAKVDYELARQGGAWRVTDFLIDGVSTADGYATSFQRVIKRKGYDALLQSLKKRLAREEAGA